MSTARLVIAILTLTALTSCYAARVETGLKPSNVQIKKTFAASWIHGLVPPSTIETAARCPDGVAIVETKLSFLNQVVAGLTFGIYTPMEIDVICAEKSAVGLIRPETEIRVASSATSEEWGAALSRAADEAVRTRKPVALYTTP